MMLVGTCSIGTIWSLLGSLSQPTAISSSTTSNVVFISIIPRNGFAAGSRGERPECQVGQRGLEESDMPVGEQKVHAAGMAAIELVDFAVRVPRPEAPTRVPQDHA